jgi:hypothetical protein
MPLNDLGTILSASRWRSAILGVDATQILSGCYEMLSLSARLPRARGLATFGQSVATRGQGYGGCGIKNSAMAIAVAVVANAIVNREAIPANRSADGGVTWRRFRPFGSEWSRTSPAAELCRSKSCGAWMRRNEEASGLSAGLQRLFQHVLHVHMKRKRGIHVVPRIRD